MDTAESEIVDGKNEILDISDSIRDVNQLFDEILETNDLNLVLDKIEINCDKSIYHLLLRSLCLAFMAFITMQNSDIERAEKSIDDLAKLSSKCRKSGFIVNAIKLIKTPNYQNYTDLEAHSEIAYACSQSLNAYIYALKTYSIIGLIRVVFRLQKFLKIFASAKEISRKKTNWQDAESKLFLDSLIYLISGLCHLAISNIPPKLLKIVNFFGYRGIESIGFRNINRSAFELTGIFSCLSRIFLMSYWSYIEPHTQLGPENINICSQIVGKEQDRFPKSILFKTFEAKLEQISGRIDSAIGLYNDLIKNSDQTKHKLYHLELGFCYLLKSDWNQSIKYAELLRKGSIHSQAFASYMEAIFRYTQCVFESNHQIKETATELFKVIPDLRIRHLGKTMTPEKVAVLNSQKYFKCNEFLILPELELMYQFNLLTFIKDDKVLLDKILDRVEIQLMNFKHELENSDYLDNYLTALFYKGVISRYLGDMSEAKKCFNTILNDDARFGREFSIAPQSALELGLIGISTNDVEDGEKWLKKAINDYNGYQNENFVHLRAFAALRLLGINEQKHQNDEKELKQYTNEWLKNMDVNQDQIDKIKNETNSN